MKMKTLILPVIIGIILKITLIWLVASLILSAVISGVDACDKKYPIDDYLATKLLCEEK